MAIRVEFYAEDQITATGIVEYAISAGAVLQAYNEIDPPLEKPAQPDKPASLTTVPKADSYTTPKKPKKLKRADRLDYDETWYSVSDTTNPMNPGSKRHAYIASILRSPGARTLRDIYMTVQRAHSDVAPSTLREQIRFLVKEKYLETTAKPVTAPPAKRETEIAERMNYETTFVRVANRLNDSAEGSIRWNQKNIILGFRKDISLREILSTVMKRMKLTDQQESAVRAMLRDLIRGGNLEIVE